MSPASDHPDQFELGTQLRRRFHEFSARFLVTELTAEERDEIDRLHRLLGDRLGR